MDLDTVEQREPTNRFHVVLGLSMVLELSCDPEAGVIGDHGSSRRRQITLLSTEQWQSACEQVGHEVAWTTRRANLLVSGGTFGPEHDGRKLRIGTVEILIHGELVPCQQMEDQ